MMYNFVSPSFPTTKSHSRSKSLNKEGDQSSIIHASQDQTPIYRIGKLSETNFAFIPNPRSKEYYCRSSRPPTADIYGLSPNKNSLMISRSQSPFGFASPNSTITKSVATLHPQKSEKTLDSTIYDGLKTQTRLFFSRPTSTIPYAVNGKDMQKQPETPFVGYTPVASSRDPMCSSYRDSGYSSTGCSPRKRLAQQPGKMYNTSGIRLKDALKESLQTLSKARNDKTSERKRSNDKMLAAKKNKKKKVEEGKSPALIALEKRMEEERKVIDSIGNASCEKFYSNLGLYNKYYAEYLNDPDIPYTSQNDLKVGIRALVEEPNPNELKRLNAKKTLSVPKGLGNSKSKDASVEESGTIKPFVLKINVAGDTQKRGSSVGQKAAGWFSANEKEIQDKTPEEKKWNLFGKDMAPVEDNLKMLENINSLITRKGNMSQEEQDFFKAVKEGNQLLVHALLRYNGELAKAKDIRNQTPLHWAVKRHYPEIVGELLEYGADFEAIDMTGRKPLDLTQGTNKKAIMEVLEQRHWQMKRKTAISGS